MMDSQRTKARSLDVVIDPRAGHDNGSEAVKTAPRCESLGEPSASHFPAARSLECDSRLCRRIIVGD